MSIKIFKVNYFSYNCKLNKKKKVQFKIWFGEGGYTKIFVGGKDLMFNNVLKIFQKRGLDKKGVEKSGCDPQGNYALILHELINAY